MTRHEILIQQEEMLWFEHFTNEDGWDLGCHIREKIRQSGYEMSVCIRMNHGYTVFQYGTNGTGLSYQGWMHRKIHTAQVMGMSSLQAAVFSEEAGMSLTEMNLNETDDLLRGGGFPIRVKGIGLVGAAAVSGLHPDMDHSFLVDCLASYLGVDHVPRLDEADS